MTRKYRVYSLIETNDGKAIRLQLKSVDTTTRHEFADINVSHDEALALHVGSIFSMTLTVN